MKNKEKLFTSVLEKNRRSFVSSSSIIAISTVFSFSFIDEVEAAEKKKSKYEIPQTGFPAPKFTLPSTNSGKIVSLENLVSTGTWTVLYFYPGAFTNGCTLEARGFQKDLDEYKKRKTTIVGVSVDSLEKNTQFCNSEGLDFMLLSDVEGKVSKSYGSALSVPGFGTFSNRQTYIIDPSGNLRWVFTDVESHVSRHSTEVLEKLTELQLT